MMRTIEIILVIFNVLTFFTCVLPRIRAVRWVSYLPIATLLVAGVQIIAEGSRWQMIPGYVMTSIFFLIWLLGALTGRLDLGRLGTFGVSLGGMNAAEACLKDPRFKASLIMDVWMPEDVVTSGLQQPSMFLTRDANSMRLEGWSEHDIALTVNTMRNVYEKLPGDGYYIEIPKMFHVNFTDIPYWSPAFSLIDMTGPINGQRGFDIVNAYSVAFFNKELKGQTSSLLNGPTKQYPEVNLERLRE